MEKDKKPFKFPRSLLNQIGECSNGGYTLFVFDSKGVPTVFTFSETLPHAYAMQYFMDNYVKGIEAQNIEIALDSIKGEDDDKDESDENL